MNVKNTVTYFRTIRTGYVWEMNDNGNSYVWTRTDGLYVFSSFNRTYHFPGFYLSMDPASALERVTICDDPADEPLWYAVMYNTEDIDWGYGSYSKEEAYNLLYEEMLIRGHHDAYIAVVREGTGDPVQVGILTMSDRTKEDKY